MVGPDGQESPSSVGPFLIWQQPHPIYYAELCYRQDANSDTLNVYRDVVFETADFMADFAHWNEVTKMLRPRPSPHSGAGESSVGCERQPNL